MAEAGCGASRGRFPPTAIAAAASRAAVSDAASKATFAALLQGDTGERSSLWEEDAAQLRDLDEPIELDTMLPSPR